MPRKCQAMNRRDLDIIVIGGGHAGAEAAWAAARLGSRVALVSMDPSKIGQMSCNPAIGGLAKGQMVREVDALGGLMGLATDATGIQFRMLNLSKGPAVWGPRAQADKYKYAAKGLSGCLQKLGLEIGRLKTGTPPRLKRQSIDFSPFELQPGDDQPMPFSYLNEYASGRSDTAKWRPPLQQICCWLGATNESIHQIIRANLHRAPMYSGQIASTGPRYCPSIEDKVVRFAEKRSHQIFLEPEGLDTDEIYCNGISTSLPSDVQDQIIRLVPGLEEAEVLRYGYAVEYDMVWPTQIRSTLETKKVAGLFLAGQINGTSGYEEAAAQGIVAGINASQYAAIGVADFVLRRDQAYTGVLVHDLVTKPPT